MLKLESNNLVEVLNHIQLSGLWGLTSQTSGPDFNNKNVRTISLKWLMVYCNQVATGLTVILLQIWVMFLANQ